MGPARAWLRGRLRRRVFARPTSEGAWFVLVLFGVLIAALNTGNNLLYFVLGTQLALLVLSNALAEWNLRGLAVRRRLPAELFAGQPAAGAFVVENRRRFGASWALHLEELDGVLGSSSLERVGVGETAEAAARWTLPERGLAQLTRVRVWSSWPFGLVRRWRELDVPAELIVYPAPSSAWALPPGGVGTGDRERPDLAGRAGDFRGLRPYLPGDPLRDLHWATSARLGQPTVVERAAESADEVLVEVPERSGPSWERALSEATGAVLLHLRLGRAVGLHLGTERLRPGIGEGWRRRLLLKLALAPRRDIA